jgi:hypothetical protein
MVDTVNPVHQVSKVFQVTLELLVSTVFQASTVSQVKPVHEVHQDHVVDQVNQVHEVPTELQVHEVDPVKTVNKVPEVLLVQLVNKVLQAPKLSVKLQWVPKVTPVNEVLQADVVFEAPTEHKALKVEPVPPDFQVCPVQPVLQVNQAVAVKKVQPATVVTKVSPVLTVSTVNLAQPVIEATPKLSVLFLLDTRRIHQFLNVQPVPSRCGVDFLCFIPSVTITTMPKVSADLVRASENSIPCQVLSAAATKFADTVPETLNLTG